MKSKHLFKKYLLRCLAVLVVLVALVLATLSFSVPFAAKRVLSNYDIALDISRTHINPLTGRLKISDLRLADVANSNPLTIKMFAIDLNMQQLLKRHIQADSILLEGVYIPLTASEHHTLMAGIEPTRFGQNQPTADGDAKPNQPPDTSDSWNWSWKKLALSDIHAEYATRANSVDDNIKLALQSFSAGELSSLAPTTQTPVSLATTIENIHIGVDGSAAPLADATAGKLDISIENLALKAIQKIAAAIALDLPTEFNQADGLIDFTGKLQWEISEEKASLILSHPLINGSGLSFATTDDNGTVNHSLIADSSITLDSVEVDLSSNGIIANNIAASSREIHYSNKAHQPPTALQLTDLTLQVDRFNSGDHFNGGNSRSNIQLTTSIGEFGRVNAAAKMAVTGVGDGSEFNVAGEQINLTEFSGFASAALDKKITRGALDFNVDGRIDNDQIDSESNWVLHQLGFSALKSTDSGDNNERTATFETQLGMPLNTALNLLRDNDDSIRLKIPVSGPLDDPQINVNNIINKAVLKTLKTAVLTQLGPLMAISALDNIKSLADAARLKPVYFNSGDSSLAPPALDTLNELADFLQRRDKIYINVCAWANQGESSKPGQEEALAKQRAAKVKDYLIHQQIDGKRLILCAPEIDASGEAKPRVEFSL